jgi:hypothetical protein
MQRPGVGGSVCRKCRGGVVGGQLCASQLFSASLISKPSSETSLASTEQIVTRVTAIVRFARSEEGAESCLKCRNSISASD